MVKKSEWSDKQLEQLLREMPKIEDHRDPRDIYQNVAAKLNKSKRRTWVFPSVATAAAAFVLFLIISPNLTNWQTNSSMESNDMAGNDARMEIAVSEDEGTENDASMEIAATEDESAENKGFAIDSKESEVGVEEASPKIALTDVADPITTAVYDEDTVGNEVFTFSIPDQQVNILVPISVVVPDEPDKTRFQQFLEVMGKIPEAELGLTEYYPLNATLSFNEESRVLNIDVPENHHYGTGSTEQYMFMDAVTNTLRMLSPEKITLSTNGNRGIIFDNYGLLEELPIEEDKSHAYYFYYPSETVKKPLLVPSRQTFSDMKEALKEMKNNLEEEGLMASIPSDVELDVKESNSSDLLVIRFDKNTKITNDPATIQMIEAILLTAKEFNFDKVQFENAPLEQVGPFLLNQELKVPVAPNKQIILE